MTSATAIMKHTFVIFLFWVTHYEASLMLKQWHKFCQTYQIWLCYLFAILVFYKFLFLYQYCNIIWKENDQCRVYKYDVCNVTHCSSIGMGESSVCTYWVCIDTNMYYLVKYKVHVPSHKNKRYCLTVLLTAKDIQLVQIQPESCGITYGTQWYINYHLVSFGNVR